MRTRPLTSPTHLCALPSEAQLRLQLRRALCQLLDVCPLLTDLRLRCCAPPKDAKQLPDLMALPLPPHSLLLTAWSTVSRPTQPL